MKPAAGEIRTGVLAAAVGLALAGFALAAPGTGASVGQAHTEGVGHFRSGEYAQAVACFEYELKSNPGNTRALLFLALAAQRLEDWDRALRSWQAYLASQPPRRELAFIRRQLDFCTQRLASSGAGEQEGAGWLARAVPPSARLQEADWATLASVEEQTYTEITSHCRVRARNARLAKLVAEEAEFALDRIVKTVLRQQAYPHTIDVLVWPDPATMQEEGGVPEWGSAGFAFRVDEEGGTVRRVDLCQLTHEGEFDRDLLARALPHELCHVVVTEFFGQRTCPLWLSEGLAIMAEANAGREHDNLLRAMVREGRHIELSSLLGMRRYEPEQVHLFYAQSVSIARFLFSKLSDDQATAFLGHMKEGKPFQEALELALVLPHDPGRIERLEAAWRRYVLSEGQG